MNTGAGLVLLLHRVRAVCRLCQTAAETKAAATPAPTAFFQKAGLFLAVASCNILKFIFFFSLFLETQPTPNKIALQRAKIILGIEIKCGRICKRSITAPSHNTLLLTELAVSWDGSFSQSPFFSEIEMKVASGKDGKLSENTQLGDIHQPAPIPVGPLHAANSHCHKSQCRNTGFGKLDWYKSQNQNWQSLSTSVSYCLDASE